MAGAIELIVDGYVRLKDRKALDDLCTQRRKLVADLNASTGIDCSSTIQQIEEDIVVIEAGLARLDEARASVLRTETIQKPHNHENRS